MRRIQSSPKSTSIKPELLQKLRELLAKFELENSRVGLDFKSLALLETLKLSDYLVNQLQQQPPCILLTPNIPPPPPPPMPIIEISKYSTPERRLPKALLEKQTENTFVDEIKMGRRLRVISLKRNPSGTPVKSKKFVSEEDFFFDQIKKKFAFSVEKPDIEFEDW